MKISELSLDKTPHIYYDYDNSFTKKEWRKNMRKKTIGILVGSLREKSYNKSIANYVASEIPKDYNVIFIDIKNVDFYDQDLEENPPESWIKLREAIASCDAYIFFTPEYNRSFPAVLKNALDVASRPQGKSVWSHKAAGLISVSPGSLGAFGANQHLRQVLSSLDIYVLNKPEIYIGHVDQLIDEHGFINNFGVKKLLNGFLVAYLSMIEHFN